MINDDALKLFSLPFDFHLWLDDERIDALIEEVSSPFLTNRAGSKIRDSYKEKLLTSYKIIILNLLLVYKHKAAKCLAIPRDNSAIQPKTRYDPRDLVSVRSFNEAYEALSQNHIKFLIQGKEGWAGEDGFRTRVTSHQLLKDLFDKYFPQELVFFQRHPNEEIIIKKSGKYDDEDTFIDYTDTEDTIKQRENLKFINHILQSNWYDLELTDKQFDELRERMRRRRIEETKKDFFVNYTNRRLKRIYSNGSFKKGGRFYGGWWQSIPRTYRQYIRINGKIATEVDFSNMHPYILYARKRLQLDRDAYLIDGISRKKAKKAFSLLLNKESFKKPKEYNSDEWDGYEWKDLRELVVNHHEAIQEFFGTGVGLELQFIDSQVAERVLLHFAKSGYPCLPLHDSFIVHHALRDELISVMKEEYINTLGLWDIGVEVKDYFKSYIEEYSNEDREVSESLDESLGLSGDYKEYSRRLQLWYSNQS